MRYLLFPFLLLSLLNMKTIFDFHNNADTSNWYVVVDGVMGGKSTGSLKVNDEGHGLFEGTISLANNGGFSSVRYDLPEKISIGDNQYIALRLKGDGKNYQFRLKNDKENYYSYIKEFATSGDWQEIKIPLNEMYPSFRGRKLDKPNFAHDNIQEIAILIGNKKNEKFRLSIDKIELK